MLYEFSIGVASYGTMGKEALNFQLFTFWGSLQSHTNSDIRLHEVSYPEKNNIQVHGFVTVYCVKFVILFCVTLKLFLLRICAHPCTKSRRRHWL